MPELDGVRILPVVMLRHPIDRVGSVYAFEVKQEANTPGAVNAKTMTFPQYVTWRMDPSVGATIRNFQTRCCCGRRIKVRDPVTDQDVEAALRQLQGTPLMGIVERYDESMVLFEHTLQPFFPDISLAYVKQNVRKGRKGTLEERVQHIYDGLGPEITTVLRENNQGDRKLYEEADALLSKRIDALPAFDKKLKAFHKRCRRFKTVMF